MRLEFNYSKHTVSVDVPPECRVNVLTPNEVKGYGENEVQRALNEPIGSKRLSRIAKSGDKVAIITSDITRPMPTYAVLPFVVDELNSAGVPDEDIILVFALGSHRRHTVEEMIKLAGAEMYERIRCMDCAGDFTYVGTTERGTPVNVFSPVVNANVRVCLGNIEYHYFAGYSGGAKAIMPGVSTREAIQANHSRMVDPDAHAGRLSGNPVREDIEEAAALVGIDFIVNVVLDEHKHIKKCVAGDWIKAHRAGCEYLDAMYKVKIPERADIVIVSPGGYPKDINLYQAQKALDNAKHAVKKDGVIIWLAEAGEGLGEKTFEEWMTGHEKASDMIEHIAREFRLGGHKAAAIAMVLQNARVFLVSGLSPEFVKSIHLEPYSSAQSALDAALKLFSGTPSVIAMPFGGSTLPELS